MACEKKQYGTPLGAVVAVNLQLRCVSAETTSRGGPQMGYNRVAVTALAGIPRGQPSSKLTSKRAGTPRRWLRALQCRSDAPSMSVPGQRWSDRERLGSSMLTDIGGAAHTNTSHSSQLNPMSPTRCSATLDIFEVNFDEGCRNVPERPSFFLSSSSSSLRPPPEYPSTCAS